MRIRPPGKAQLRVATIAITAVMCTLLILSAVFPFPEGTWSFLSIGTGQKTLASPSFTARTETYATAASLSSPFDLTVNKPTGTAEDNILFGLVCWYGSGVGIDSAPSGWTKAADLTTYNDQYAVYYKVAGASEPSSYTWSFDASCKVRITCCCYTSGDFDGADPIDVVSNTAYRTFNTNCPAASMTVSATDSPLVFFGGFYTAAVRTFTEPSVPTTDWVEDDDAGDTDSDFSCEVASMIWSGSGATGDMVASTSFAGATKHAFAIALNPAAAEPDWLSGWSYRKQKTIGAANSSISEFTVTGGATPLKLHTGNGTDDADDLYFNGKCKDYFDDIRVTEDDGTTEIPFYIRACTQTTGELCVLTGVDTSSIDIYIYYGNSSATRKADAYAAFLEAEFVTTQVTIDESGDYNAWPGIIRLHDGTLFACYSRGSSHTDNGTNLYYSVSTDGGRTWSTPTLFCDGQTGTAGGKGWSDSDEVMVNAPMATEIQISGTWTILVHFQRCDRTDTYDEHRMTWVTKCTNYTDNWGSETWGTPIWVSGYQAGASWEASDARGARCRVIEASDGNLYCCTYNSNDWKIYIEKSTDKGDTWYDSSKGDQEVLIGTDATNQINEPVVLEILDGGQYNGDLYVLARCSGGDYNPRRFLSADYGANWGAAGASGLTADQGDALDMIQLADGTSVAVWAYYADSNAGELRIAKASAEDEDITWDTTNYAMPWRYHNTSLSMANYAYPSICELENGGQMGLVLYIGLANDDTDILFHYVETGSFNGSRFSHSTTAYLSTIGHYTRLTEVEGSNNLSVWSIDPQTDHSVSKWIWEMRAKASGQGTDQNAIYGCDGSTSHRAFGWAIPQRTDQANIGVIDDGGDVWVDLYKQADATIYRHITKVYEDTHTADYLIYADTWGVALATDTGNDEYGTPSDVDGIYLGSSSTLAEAYIDIYEMTIRKYAATEPAWGTTGSEESYSVDITNTPSSNDFGILDVNTTGNTPINYFQIENTGTCNVDVVIYGTDLTGGGDTWTLSDTATPDENVYGLYAGLDDADDNFDVIVRKTATYNTLVSNLPEDATQDWGLKIYMPTSLSGYDAQQMSGTVTLVATASS